MHHIDTGGTPSGAAVAALETHGRHGVEQSQVRT